MIVRIRLFAILRERAGRNEIELELAPDATVGDALRALRRDGPLAGVIDRLPLRMAVNREYATDETPLSADDELALIPPVSGGASGADLRVHARVTREPLSVEALARAVGRPRAGALVLFCGVTREVQRLDYEAYEEMASAHIEWIARETLRRHGLEAIAIEHRVGAVALGEPSVVVAASAAHRAEAFAGAREAIDRVKGRAPIWKAEVEHAHPGGAQERRWVSGTPPPQDRPPRDADGPRPHADGPDFTHLDREGRARMVDVGAKAVTERRALARARVRTSPQTAAAILAGDAPKGDVLGTARLAGIQAAKAAARLIPLAHPIALTFADVHVSVDAHAGVVELLGEAHAVARTGVELEAMTASAVAALTVYDMVKALERGVAIEQVVLLSKSGGRAEWRRPGEPGELDQPDALDQPDEPGAADAPDRAQAPDAADGSPA